MSAEILWHRFLAAPLFLLVMCAPARSEPAADAEIRSRGGVSGGMGVVYVNAVDIVNFVNSTQGALEHVPSFKSGVELFVAGSVPISRDWILKVEYAYELLSMNISTVANPAEFTVKIHCPTVIAQYVVAERGLYNLKLGGGIGYSVGSLSESYLYIDDSFTGTGPSFVLDVEANTAFGENLFAYLGANARWQVIGELSDSAGRTPGGPLGGNRPTLHAIVVGARLGFTYYLF